MSTCISSHGEFGAHTPDGDYVCTLCGVLDEDGLIAELRNARARIAEPTTAATWTYPDGTTVPVPVVHRSPTADASVVRIIVENRTATFTPNGPPFYSVEERAAMESRIADLERQRDEVLALHRPRVIRGLDGKDIVTEFCAHDDEVMPCPTAAIYGGGQ